MKKDTRDGSGLIVGVDLGDRWSRYCVLDQKDQVLEEDSVATTGRAFRKLFGDRPAARVVIEVGTHSPWVQRLLQEFGHETITANPRYVRLIDSSGSKNPVQVLARTGTRKPKTRGRGTVSSLDAETGRSVRRFTPWTTR
jgi:transposase